MFEQNNQPNKISEFFEKIKKKVIAIKDEVKIKISAFFEKHPLPNKIKKPATTISETVKSTTNDLGESRFAFWFNVTYGVMKSLILMMVIVFLFVGALVGGIGAGYFAYLVSDTSVPTQKELETAMNDLSEVTFLTYSGGEEIAEIKSDIIRTTVNYDDISPLVLDAIVSTEDENFYEHDGIVPKALVRALISDTVGVGSSSGGSTLTQQIVKQQILTSETTFKRKANEIVLAMRIENYFSKKEIITAYLNVSPFGRNNKGENIAGVQEAAMGIFGVNSKDLSLPQAAFIAGLPQSPITYSPYTNTGELKEDYSDGLERKDDVLFNMYRNQKISKQEYDDAVAYDLASDFLPQGEATSLEQSGYLYYYVLDEAVKVLMPTYYEADNVSAEDIEASDNLYNKYYAIAERELRRSGYTIQSTVDQTIYDTMQNSVAVHGASLDEGNGKTVETGSVLLENSTGKVLGLIGGRDYTTNQNNHAITTKRSPGSTIKPYLGYAPALDIGLIGTQSQLSNFARTYNDEDKKDITNYGGKVGNSFVSVEYALNQSLNIPVVNLYDELKKNIDPTTYTNKMNMSLTDDEVLNNESIIVGGTDWGVTNIEQVGAFATLANKGQFNQPYVIEKITDSTGKTIYEHESNPVNVFSPATASIMNEMMRSVIQTGTGTTAKNTMASLNATLASGDWVGKTGTAENNNDYWFIASNPSVTLSSWIGYDDNSEMGVGGGQTNMKYWANVVNDVYQVNPDIFNISQKFTLDSSVIKADVSKMTGEKAGSFINNNKVYTVGEPLVSSLFATKGPTASKYKFGIGGTDANYAAVWSGVVSDDDKKEAEEKAEEEQKKAEEELKKAEEAASSSSSEENTAQSSTNAGTYDAAALEKWRKENGKSDTDFPTGSVTYSGKVVYY